MGKDRRERNQSREEIGMKTHQKMKVVEAE